MPIDLSNLAIKLRKAGHLTKAEPLLRRALELDEKTRGTAHPKIPHRLNNLCTVLIMQGKLNEAKTLLVRAWQLKSGQHDLTSVRLLFVRLTVALLEAQSPVQFIGQLRTLLAVPELPDHADVDKTSDIGCFIEHLNAKLGAQNTELLHAFAAALNDHSKVSELDRFSEWKNQPSLPLDLPWPEP